ncbi:MAG TPA: CHASE2 domain-containing protein [Novosphingobium sp.]
MTLGRRLRRLTIEWWLVALLSSVFVLLLARSHATDRIDDLAYDGMLQLQTHEPDDRILLVVIDNRSLQHIGRWPWPRATHVRLLDRIAAGHPAAIVYDVLFVEPGPDDAALGQALARSAPVLLPLLTGGPGDDGVRLDSILPVPPVLRAAAGIGHVNLITDADGVVRRARLVEPDGTRRWPHLMELARRTVAPQTARSLPRETDSVLLPFAGPSGHFPSIGADAVLRGEFPPELLRNRIVIVGATAPGLGDRYAVPLSGPGAGMSGVEIQANLLDGLLRDGLATEAGFALRALAALIPLWLLLLALRKLRPVAIIPVLGGLVALVIAVSGLSFHFLGIWIPPTPALAGLALVYPLWGWRRLAGVSGYMVSELERLRNEPEILPTFAAPDIHADPIAREAMMLGEAVSKLRTMRRFVADSMDQLPDAVFVVDGMGLITLANRRAKQLLASLPHANASDRVIDLLRWLRPVDERNELVPWPPTGPASRHEAQMPDGRVFEVVFGEHRDGVSQPMGWIVRMSDISAARTAKRQRDHMLYYLTHDMRAPQASILALTSGVGADEIQPDLARRIERYAHRTLALADGIVHLARAETLAYEPILLNVSDLLSEAIDELWPQIRERALLVELAGTDEDMPVRGEPSLLARALINLLDNAVKYNRPAGRLDCSLERGETEGIPVAICRIGDEGEGMPAEWVASLFERFQRAPAEAGTRGAGLGLAFVQTVVARHGGSIRCDSTVGAGTTFTITLPLAVEAGASTCRPM